MTTTSKGEQNMRQMTQDEERILVMLKREMDNKGYAPVTTANYVRTLRRVFKQHGFTRLRDAGIRSEVMQSTAMHRYAVRALEEHLSVAEPWPPARDLVRSHTQKRVPGVDSQTSVVPAEPEAATEHAAGSVPSAPDAVMTHESFLALTETMQTFMRRLGITSITIKAE